MSSRSEFQEDVDFNLTVGNHCRQISIGHIKVARMLWLAG
jgi:hypothetical protein